MKRAWRLAAVATLGAAAAVLVQVDAGAEPPPRRTLELTVDGQRLEGMPLAWSDRNVYLLARDGRLWDFAPGRASDFREKAPGFQSYSAAELRGQLQRELGNGFEVTGTGHYLVCHPAGQRDLWGQRFEELYRSLVHYFRARGLTVREPEFPLVAIVLANQQDFFRYAAAHGTPVGSGVLGFYSPDTNRIVLYDTTAEQGPGADWSENAETIIHEATHQTAFNTGIHSRFAYTPRWLGEGLGTLFEAPGVWNSRYKLNQADRINRGRLEAFQKLVKQRRPAGLLAELVASDRLFQSAPAAAYAEAWALTFYLVETQPRKYGELLTLTASRPPFEPYTAQQRLADFQRVFGPDLKLLESQYLRYMESIR